MTKTLIKINSFSSFEKFLSNNATNIYVFFLVIAVMCLFGINEAHAANDMHSSLKDVAAEGKKLWSSGITYLQMGGLAAGSLGALVYNKPTVLLGTFVSVAGAEGGKIYLTSSYTKAMMIDQLASIAF